MKKYTKLICMIAAVCLLGAAAFAAFVPTPTPTERLARELSNR